MAALERQLESSPSPESFALLEHAFRTAPIGLLIATDRVITLYNETFARIFGYDERELIGRSLDCLYPSIAEFQHTGEKAAETMQKRGKYSDERIMRHRSGRLFWCHATGQAMDLNQPLASATWVFEDISNNRPVTTGLTARERQIARLLVEGRSSKQIAKELDVSPRTIEAHRARLMRKLNAQTAGALIAKLIGRSEN
ncbi:LuxR C-terminal-related transcriptional regulator [Achromobacter xylosoxidans]